MNNNIIRRADCVRFIPNIKILLYISIKDQIIIITSIVISIYDSAGFIWYEYGLFEKISPPKTINSTGKIKNNPNRNGINA